MKKNTVLITGAFGFIGRHVARHFFKNGWHVVGIGLGEWKGEEFKDWGIDEWYSGLITKELLLSVEKKPDVIIHCAGGSSVGFSVEHPKEDFDMTVESTRTVLEHMRNNCPNARLIYPSSAAVYGQKDDVPIKEEDALEPVSPYGINKKIAEDLCEEYSKKYNLRISIVRLFSVYGEELQKQLLWDACKKIAEAEEEVVFFGTGEETRDWIHIDDVAELFFILAKSGNKFEIMNGGSGIRIAVKNIISELLKALKTEKKIVFNNISKEGDPKFYTADLNKLKKIGWKTKVSLRDGINKYVNYFKKQND